MVFKFLYALVLIVLLPGTQSVAQVSDYSREIIEMQNCEGSGGVWRGGYCDRSSNTPQAAPPSATRMVPISLYSSCMHHGLDLWISTADANGKYRTFGPWRFDKRGKGLLLPNGKYSSGYRSPLEHSTGWKIYVYLQSNTPGIQWNSGDETLKNDSVWSSSANIHPYREFVAGLGKEVTFLGFGNREAAFLRSFRDGTSSIKFNVNRYGIGGIDFQCN